jgi:integrase
MAGRLNERRIAGLGAGSHMDSDNLFLKVKKTGSRSWIFRFQIDKDRDDMGLGGYPAVSLKEARELAQDARRLVARGVNPKKAREASRRSGVAVPTFGDIAQQVIAEAQAKSLNAKARYQWGRHLGPAYCKSLLGRPIHEITTLDVAEVLKPVWKTKPEVARKLHPAIRRVFDSGRVILRDKHGIQMGPNPANWTDLRAIGFTSPERLTRGRHPSLPYPQVPHFMAALCRNDAVSALGLQLMILTNVRTRSLILAKWSEFDLKQKVWVVPREHLKDAKYRTEDFRVPLSTEAIRTLTELKKVKVSDYVLPGGREGAGCSDGVFLSLIKRLNANAPKWIDPKRNKPIAPHGFRSSFRTWAEEKTDWPREVIEEAMGHRIGNNVERAYRDTDALEKRRILMQEWSDYVASHLK